VVWEVSGNSERAWSMVDLWMTGDEMEQSFVRRQSTEPFFPVFSCSCLLSPFPYSGDNLVHGFIPSGNCQR